MQRFPKPTGAGSSPALRTTEAILADARALTDDQVRSLAALEWRSRTSDWDLYIAAGMSLSTLGTIKDWRVVHEASLAATYGRGLGVEAENIAANAIEQAAWALVHKAKLSREHYSVLGRAWRTLMKPAG